MPTSAPSSSSDHNQAYLRETWEQLLTQWLRGQLNEDQSLPEQSISSAELSPKIYFWLLAGIILGYSHRKYDFSKAVLSVFFSGLSAKIVSIIEARFEEKSGLVFLIDKTESPISDADYWQTSSQKIADPGFLALLIHALENLIQVGGQIEEDIHTLSTYYELLTFSVNEHLWNEEYGMYFPFDFEKEDLISSNSIGGLLFWLANVPDQDQAESMYRTLANNFVHPKHYYFPLHCDLESKESRKVDLLLNYLLFLGLTRFDFGPTAKALRLHTKYLIEDYGCLASFDSNRNVTNSKNQSSSSSFSEAIWKDFQQLSLLHYTNQE